MLYLNKSGNLSMEIKRKFSHFKWKTISNCGIAAQNQEQIQ